jgi:hypothetical protein
MSNNLKFKIGNEIFFLHNKKVLTTIVREITIHYSSKGKTVTYLCSKEDKGSIVMLKIDENDAFATKQELLDSL